MSFVNAATAVLALASQASAAPAKREEAGLSKVAQLLLAETSIERYEILSDDKDFMFDFTKSDTPIPTRKSFPALTGVGTSLVVGQMPGCSMAFVHLHPRAHELFAVVEGRVVSEMIPEVAIRDKDGNQRVVRTELGPSQMTIFPQGSFHTTVNPDCGNATMAVAFTSEDAGTGVVAGGALAFSDDVVSRSFGGSIAGEDIDRVRDAIPKGMEILIDECLAKCKN